MGRNRRKHKRQKTDHKSGQSSPPVALSDEKEITQKISADNSQTAAPKRSSDPKASKKMSLFKDLKITDVVIAIFTVVLAGVGILQWSIMGTGLDDARKNFEVDQRAWVGIENVQGVPIEGQPFDIEVAFKNTGKTPGKNVRAWMHYGGRSEIPAVRATCKAGLDSEPGKSVGTITPGGEYFLHVHVGILGLDLKEMLAPNQLFYVFGCIIYDDEFDKPHWSTYCTHWDDKQRGYAPCEKENDNGDGPMPK